MRLNFSGCSCPHHSNISACLYIPVQVLPEGIEAVNGSSTDMGCTSALVDSGDVRTCNSQSYLVDGCSPDIDTSTSDWASQLVTVRRNGGTAAVPFDHVLLTFGFETNVSLTGIEMDLFLCPDWDIGATRIRVYVDEEYDLAFRFGLSFLPFVQPSQSSCDSLTTVHLSGGDTLSVSSYRTFHFLMDLPYQSSIEWVHIGEVRFLGEGGGPATGTCLPTPLPRSSSTSLPSSSPSPSASLSSSSSTSTEGLSTTTSYTSTFSSPPQSPPFPVHPSQPKSESSSILHSSMPSNLVSPSAYILFPKSVFLTSPFHIKSNLFGKWAELHNELMINSTRVLSLVTDKPLPTSVPGEIHCTCSEETSTVIAVSAVSLLLIVTLTTVTLTQCLLIIRMRRSRDRSETYAVTTNSTTKTTDVPVSLNEAYGMTKITTEEVTYEVVK